MDEEKPMHETTFRRIRLPLRTVGVPCLRVTVAPEPAANAAPLHMTARKRVRIPDKAGDETGVQNGVDVSGES